jgi:hypothetical protein
MPVFPSPAAWNEQSGNVAAVAAVANNEDEEAERRKRDADRQAREKAEEEETEARRKRDADRRAKERAEEEEAEARRKKEKDEEESRRAAERERRQKAREEEEKQKKQQEEEEKNRDRERRQKEREEKQRKEKEEEEREKKERERRVKERAEKLAGSSSKLPAVSAGGGGGEFKTCKSDLVDDDKSAMSEKELAWLLEVVNNTLKSTKQFPRGFASADALAKAFRDGILPCVHLAALCPKDIDIRAINSPVDDNRDREENFALYLGAARGVGGTFDRALTRQSLLEATKEQAFACLWQNIKCFHNVSIQREASIRGAIASELGAKEADIRDEWPANKIFAGWVSVALKKRLKTVSFPELAELLPALTQHVLKGSCSSLPDAARVAAKVGIVTIPEALAAGHGRVSFAFAGDLFQQAIKK